MTDVRFPSSGNMRVWWLTASGLANPLAPTQAEIAAGMDVSDAISWNDKDFGIQASNTNNDPAITAVSNTKTRGAAQYGGKFSFYYPKVFSDPTNLYSLTYDALRLPGTAGYLVMRIDGLMLQQPTGTTANPGTSIAAGDIVNVYKVETAGYTENVTGEDAFRYTVSFLPKGFVASNAVVRASATPVAPVITTAASTLTVAAKYLPLDATLISRRYTRGLNWASSDNTKATIDSGGVITAIAAGTVTFTATDPATATPSTAKSITIS